MTDLLVKGVVCSDEPKELQFPSTQHFSLLSSFSLLFCFVSYQLCQFSYILLMSGELSRCKTKQLLMLRHWLRENNKKQVCRIKMHSPIIESLLYEQHVCTSSLCETEQKASLLHLALFTFNTHPGHVAPFPPETTSCLSD